MLTGQGTDTLSISGTLGQINSYLSDGQDEYAGALGTLRAQIQTIQSILGNANRVETLVNTALQDIEKILAERLKYKYKADALQAIDQVISGLQSTLSANGLAGNVAADTVEGAFGVLRILAKVTLDAAGCPHIVTADGQIYDFNAVGEFVLGQSTQPGDSFQVQVRPQPYNESASASVITQVAAAVDPSDRVTFAVGRAATVWVNGSPAKVSALNPLTLQGGEITQPAPIPTSSPGTRARP